MSFVPVTIIFAALTLIPTSLKASEKVFLSAFSTGTLSEFLAQGHLFLAIAVTFVAGLFTALSPCIYPIIPITLSVIGARRYESLMQGFVVSFSYVSGMVSLYVSLGILFSSFGILFGNVFRHPSVLIIMAGLFLFYSLSMFGATNWLLPESALKRLSSFGGSGIKGAFLMGLVSGLIASPCTGPVLAFILTLISGQGDIGTGSILMISFGLGMGLPFLILGTFSSVLARIPRSGAWLNRIKVAFGLVMLSSSIYFFQLGLNGLLKSQNQDSGFEASLNWLHIGQQENALDKLEKILQIYKDQGFPVLIDFYASWCIACGELEKLTFQDPEVSKALKDFKLIRIDLSIETATLKLIEKKFGIVGLPLVVFYNRKGVLLENPKIYGFMDSKAFLKLLEDLKKSPGL